MSTVRHLPFINCVWLIVAILAFCICHTDCKDCGVLTHRPNGFGIPQTLILTDGYVYSQFDSTTFKIENMTVEDTCSIYIRTCACPSWFQYEVNSTNNAERVIFDKNYHAKRDSKAKFDQIWNAQNMFPFDVGYRAGQCIPHPFRIL